SWSVQPDTEVVERAYRENTSTIETRWGSGGGSFLSVDGLVADATSSLRPSLLLVRRVECIGGSGVVRVTFDPRLGIPGKSPSSSVRCGVLVCAWNGIVVSLACDRSVDVKPGKTTEVDLRAGEAVTFAMTAAHNEPLVFVPPDLAYSFLRADDAWWRDWAARFRYDGPHRGTVLRSLITLRLLTYAPSGAPVAAPTTSLPAPPNSSRTWDYRYAWPRDASIGIGTFLGLGSTEEPYAFLNWLDHASRETRPRLGVLYSVDGRRVRDETEATEVSGYGGGLPVRIGNGATSQVQLDVYGWVLDAAWLIVRSGKRLRIDTWRALRSFADHVCRQWQYPDNGVWEVRSKPRHYVHSKLMAWTALDRAVRIARTYPASRRRTARWERNRDALAAEIRSRGFDAARGTYVRAYGSEELDAANLILAVLDFEPPGSPRVAGTVDAIRAELSAGGPFLYRYLRGSDGLDAFEGAFLPCSFWLVMALVRLGRISEASDIFSALCETASPLGLFAEQYDPATASLMGNFPQALTHAALLQAAIALNAAGEKHRESRRMPREQSS
ncbi:MAG: glycoside hydrolase family 15 protein, partial [Actinobacteria bacterium]|nr:glycoside hydrolase family 15 protein [Actinomycetota bacterium]